MTVLSCDEAVVWESFSWVWQLTRVGWVVVGWGGVWWDGVG